MGQLLGQEIPVDLPTFGGLGINPTTLGLIVLIIFIIAGGIVGSVLIHRFKVFNKKIVVFENVSGRGYQVIFKDRARLLRLGAGGEELLYLKKKKLYRAAYGRKMGKNTYWFAIGQDGYWYNIVLGDVDAKMGMLDIEPIDRDMRYMHVALRKNINDMYKKPNIMEKYGTYIMSGIFLIIMLVGIWLLLNKIGTISEGQSSSIQASENLVISSEKLITSIDNICTSGGSSIVPVEI